MKRRNWLREELLHMLSLSGNLSGLCITAVTLLHGYKGNSAINTIADDLLALSALLFLICTYLIFIILRKQDAKRAQRLESVVDSFFFLALTIMVATGFIMVYTIW